MPIWRSMLVDTPLLRDIPLFILVIFWLAFLANDMLHKRSVKADLLSIFVGLYLIYGLFMIIYAMEIAELDVFSATNQFRNYFFPLILFYIARRAFVSTSSVKLLLWFFFIIFSVNAYYIILEFGSQFISYDIHNLPWHAWRIQTDTRFLGGAVSLPSIALGIQGFPHYTAPGFVALFSMIFPFIMRKNVYYSKGWPLMRSQTIAFFYILGIMILSIIFLSVKTHMVTTLLVIFGLTLFIHRKYSIYFGVYLALIIIVLLNFEVFTDRIDTLWHQLTIGDPKEGTRINVIFNLEGLKFYLDNPLRLIIFGTGNLQHVIQDIFSMLFEIKYVVYLFTFGAIWFFLFVGISFISIVYAINICRNKHYHLQDRLFSAGIIGMTFVFLIELGHYGQAIAMPNIEIWFISLGVFSSLRQRVKHEKYIRMKRRILTVEENMKLQCI